MVMIVLDDLDFAQFGCYGSDIQTPAIDRLARNGLRCNRFHATGLCSPTCVALLTDGTTTRSGWAFLPTSRLPTRATPARFLPRCRHFRVY